MDAVTSTITDSRSDVSSDNYYLIWKRDGKFHVGMFFMSDEEVGELGDGEVQFDSLEDAFLYSEQHYSEYGTMTHPSVYA